MRHLGPHLPLVLLMTLLLAPLNSAVAQNKKILQANSRSHKVLVTRIMEQLIRPWLW